MDERETAIATGDRTPWDPWNGFRVGGLVGGIIGVVGAVLVANIGFWVVPIGAIVGGILGYRSEKQN